MSRVLTASRPVCGHRTQASSKAWSQMLCSSQSLELFLRHTTWAEGVHPTELGGGALTLPPGALKPTLHGLVGPTKDCHRILTQKTGNAMYNLVDEPPASLQSDSLLKMCTTALRWTETESQPLTTSGPHAGGKRKKILGDCVMLVKPDAKN